MTQTGTTNKSHPLRFVCPYLNRSIQVRLVAQPDHDRNRPTTAALPLPYHGQLQTSLLILLFAKSAARKALEVLTNPSSPFHKRIHEKEKYGI